MFVHILQDECWHSDKYETKLSVNTLYFLCISYRMNVDTRIFAEEKCSKLLSAILPLHLFAPGHHRRFWIAKCAEISVWKYHKNIMSNFMTFFSFWQQIYLFKGLIYFTHTLWLADMAGPMALECFLQKKNMKKSTTNPLHMFWFYLLLKEHLLLDCLFPFLLLFSTLSPLPTPSWSSGPSSSAASTPSPSRCPQARRRCGSRELSSRATPSAGWAQGQCTLDWDSYSLLACFFFFMFETFLKERKVWLKVTRTQWGGDHLFPFQIFHRKFHFSLPFLFFVVVTFTL